MCEKIFLGFFFFIEIWILYCSKEGGKVLKVVEEVYYYYENIEFMSKLVEIDD